MRRDHIIELAPAGDIVDHQRLGDQVAHGHARVERAERVLEDHAHLAAQRLHLVLADLGDVDALAILGAKPDLAVGRVVQPQDRAAGGGFAAAALAHQPQHLLLAQREADAIDGLDVADHAAAGSPGESGSAA